MAAPRASDAELPPTELATLGALVDTLAPASSSPGLAWPSASSIGVGRDIAAVIERELPAEQRAQFRQLLRTVESPLANLLLTGRPGRFSRLAPAARERYLAAWAESRLGVKRRGFQAIKRLALFLYYAREVPGSGPIWDAVRYRAPGAPADPALGPVRGPEVPAGDVEVACDVLVVGSGAGGAAAAAHLARAGHRVVVLEAGPWRTAPTFPRREAEAMALLFEGRGLLTTRDLALVVLAGATAGGSTTINWMTCLEPSRAVRAEWAEATGAPDLAGAEFDARLQEASTRIGVTVAESQINPPNDVLQRGCAALGYSMPQDYDIIRRNAAGCAGRCGVCVFGCPWDAKRSALVTYLDDAMAAGARLFCDTRAELVETAGGRATGVVAVHHGADAPHRVHVRARAVVLAGGAVRTPGLLERSRVGPPGTGQGLRLHPTTAVFGEFDRPMRMWEGPMQTIVVRRFARTDPTEHGPWLETAPAHPGLAALALPWTSASVHRDRMLRLERAAATIVLVRDVGEGRVGHDPEGRPKLDYRLAARDRANLVRGMIEAARIHRAAGALRIATLHAGGLSVGDGEHPVRAEELGRFEAEIAAAGVRENDVALFSAHPTGSARLGSDPATSTCRPDGQVHGVDGLWVADGGLAPTAPGVNPMLTIYALALRTARAVDRSLRSPGR